MEAKLDEILRQMGKLGKRIEKAEERMLTQMSEVTKSNQHDIKELKEENKILREIIAGKWEKLEH